MSVPAIAHATVGHISRLDELELSYSGSLASGMYVALIDSQQNGNRPCYNGQSALHTPDLYHTGPIQSDANKVLKFNSNSLSSLSTFAVCYHYRIDLGGDSWYDTAIRVKISQIGYINYSPDPGIAGRIINGLQSGANSVPYQDNIHISYGGILPKHKWISFVKQDLYYGRCSTIHP